MLSYSESVPYKLSLNFRLGVDSGISRLFLAVEIDADLFRCGVESSKFLLGVETEPVRDLTGVTEILSMILLDFRCY